jgi:predicted ATP-dependent endonuclease of OLD family
MYLHARSQSDLLMHFEKNFNSQIICTTHSPFMVPTHRLGERARDVMVLNPSEATLNV